jgi:HAD superfamily hydrolase (TIGR01509 family)
MGLKNVFDNIYSSSEVGYLKSEPEFYQYIINDLGLDPEEILFIDDRQRNIDLAQSLGLVNSYLVNNFTEAKKILKKFNLL